MRRSITLKVAFLCSIHLARVAFAGEPATPGGIDVVVGDAQGERGATVVVPVRFVPGASDGVDGGPDEITSLSFSLGFAGLEFDTTDADPADGLPDAIVFNPGANAQLDDYTVTLVNAATIERDQRLEFLIFDATRSTILPAVTLLSLSFRIPTTAASGARIPLLLSNVLARDLDRAGQPIDEAVSGLVIAGADTPTPSPSATPTGTSTRPPATPRPTRTPAPPSPGPNTPPPNIDLEIHSRDGGCSLGHSPANGALPAVLTVIALLRRRSRP